MNLYIVKYEQVERHGSLIAHVVASSVESAAMNFYATQPLGSVDILSIERSCHVAAVERQKVACCPECDTEFGL